MMDPLSSHSSYASRSSDQNSSAPLLDVIDMNQPYASENRFFDEFIIFLRALERTKYTTHTHSQNGYTYTVGRFCYAFDTSHNLKHISFAPRYVTYYEDDLASSPCSDMEAVTTPNPSACSAAEDLSDDCSTYSRDAFNVQKETLNKCLSCFQNPEIKVSYTINSQKDLDAFYDLLNSLCELNSNPALDLSGVKLNFRVNDTAMPFINNTLTTKSLTDLKRLQEREERSMSAISVRSPSPISLIQSAAAIPPPPLEHKSPTKHSARF